MKLDTNKATGPDTIRPTVLRNIAPYISIPLTKIINNSYNKGICPNAFKTADFLPVYKNGNRQVISNYRHISIISGIAKICEKCLQTRMVSFTKNMNILSDKQYRGGKKSTEGALENVTA